MYKIDRSGGGVQKSFTRTDPNCSVLFQDLVHTLSEPFAATGTARGPSGGPKKRSLR